MSLGLNTGSADGDYADLIKFDARAGRMFRCDRAQAAGGAWETDNVEITDGFQAIFEMNAIEVGWGLFVAGAAPSFVLTPLGQPIPARPSDQHKQIFRLRVKLGKSCGGDVREFASQAKAVISAVDALHSAYEAEVAANPGKLPVVVLNGSTPVVSSGKGQTSTNYSPNLSIVAWAPIPPEFGGSVGSVKGETLPKTAPVAAAPVKKAAASVESEF